jgi:hypothetical protein
MVSAHCHRTNHGVSREGEGSWMRTRETNLASRPLIQRRVGVVVSMSRCVVVVLVRLLVVDSSERCGGRLRVGVGTVAGREVGRVLLVVVIVFVVG